MKAALIAKPHPILKFLQFLLLLWLLYILIKFIVCLVYTPFYLVFKHKGKNPPNLWLDLFG